MTTLVMSNGQDIAFDNKDIAVPVNCFRCGSNQLPHYYSAECMSNEYSSSTYGKCNSIMLYTMNIWMYHVPIEGKYIIHWVDIPENHPMKGQMKTNYDHNVVVQKGKEFGGEDMG